MVNYSARIKTESADSPSSDSKQSHLFCLKSKDLKRLFENSVIIGSNCLLIYVLLNYIFFNEKIFLKGLPGSVQDPYYQEHVSDISKC